jgi:nicotinamide mononucleotide (NMN) deamidase PncC
MGLTTYSNEAKIKILKVNKNVIKKYGAVSKECAANLWSRTYLKFQRVKLMYL